MIRNMMELKWPEIDCLDKEKTAVFLGFAPVEEHGRHLPLGVDVYETQYWMEQTVKELEKGDAEWSYLFLPVIPYGHAEMKGFTGNIHLSQKLLYDLVLATLQNVVEWGIKHIIIISGHADPKHTIAIEQACETIEKGSGTIVFAPMGAIFSGSASFDFPDQDLKLQEKMKQFGNDYHAGWIETSNMMVIRPDLVSESYREQPDIKAEGRDMIDPQKISRLTKGYGHIGFPKEADQKMGVLLNDSVIQKLKYTVSAYLKRDHYECFAHHMLYQIPALHVKTEE